MQTLPQHHGLAGPQRRVAHWALSGLCIQDQASLLHLDVLQVVPLLLLLFPLDKRSGVGPGGKSEPGQSQDAELGWDWPGWEEQDVEWGREETDGDGSQAGSGRGCSGRLEPCDKQGCSNGSPGSHSPAKEVNQTMPRGEGLSWAKVRGKEAVKPESRAVNGPSGEDHSGYSREGPVSKAEGRHALGDAPGPLRAGYGRDMGCSHPQGGGRAQNKLRGRWEQVTPQRKGWGGARAGHVGYCRSQVTDGQGRV